MNRVTIYKDAVLTGSLLIMALYYDSFYIVLQRNKSSLYFMLLCVLYIVRMSLYGDILLVRLFPRIPYALIVFLTYTTLCWIPVIFPCWWTASMLREPSEGEIRLSGLWSHHNAAHRGFTDPNLYGGDFLV